jgi:hypothetical protein
MVSYKNACRALSKGCSKDGKARGSEPCMAEVKFRHAGAGVCSVSLFGLDPVLRGKAVNPSSWQVALMPRLQVQDVNRPATVPKSAAIALHCIAKL